MRSNRNKILLSTIIAVIVYAVGYFGITGSHPLWYASLTPFTLIMSAVLLLITHDKYELKDLLIVLIAGLAGYGVEVVGVRTGEIFGTYHYGNSLGPKWFDVSLVIGLNWAILTYCTMAIAGQVVKSLWLKATIGAMLMVAIDVLIEPVAIQLDFWHWKGGELPPLKNYLAWFIISLVIQVIAHRIKPNFKNNFGILLFIIMALFFTLLNFKL
jgi:uncharacterized membrane protein